jgi:DNA-binding LacI/PurR family transcriptional regulator
MDPLIATRRMIAREAKLSPTTVSRVLNNQADKVGIKLKTQQKVWEVAKRLNYTPNPLAVGLNGGRTNTLGLIWSLGGPHDTGKTTHDIIWRLQKRGYRTQLADHGDDPQITDNLLTDFLRRHVDGVVLQNNSPILLGEGPILPKLGEFPAALLVSGLPPIENLKIDHLFHDRKPVFVGVVEHFARIGRRRPAMLGGWPSSQLKAATFFGEARRHGMEIQAGAEIDIGKIILETMAAQSRATLEHRFDGRDFPFDALMCNNDEMAVVAIDYLRGRSLRVPEDVAVVGFNDVSLAPFHTPPLASGDRQDGPVAAIIEEMILHRLENPEAPPQRRSVPMRFVWRASAG